MEDNKIQETPITPQTPTADPVTPVDPDRIGVDPQPTGASGGGSQMLWWMVGGVIIVLAVAGAYFYMNNLSQPSKTELEQESQTPSKNEVDSLDKDLQGVSAEEADDLSAIDKDLQSL